MNTNIIAKAIRWNVTRALNHGVVEHIAFERVTAMEALLAAVAESAKEGDPALTEAVARAEALRLATNVAVFEHGALRGVPGTGETLHLVK